MALTGIPTGALVVFGIIFLALLLFVSEVIPNDITAIGVIVALVALQEWTQIGPRDAISGFSNTATVTILAMYMLSAGIQKTGIVQRLGVYLADFTRGSEKRALLATVGTTGPIAGFINNTPVVAVFIPMISDLARKTGMSPSKLLMPLSYAAILGGVLTLIGTSTNLIASEFVAATQIVAPGLGDAGGLDRGPIGMFEFTPLGAVILFVGIAYLLTVGRWLTPGRVPVDADLIEEFDLEDHLAQLRVRSDSAAVGMTIDELEASVDGEVRILQLRRADSSFVATDTDQRVQPDDVLTVHGTLQTINRFSDVQELRQLAREEVTDATFEESASRDTLAKAVVPDSSPYVGETLAETGLQEFHRTTVLAIRREGELVRAELSERTLRPGDLLLVQTTPESIEYFAKSGDLIITDEDAFDRLTEAGVEAVAPLSSKTPIAVGIMAGVVLAAALGVFPIVIAMEATGGAALIADALVSLEGALPLLGLLLLFYLATGLLANVITPVATIVLMLPVAVDAAIQLGADPFSFLLAVMFASATSFMTPIGYQTNLMVYGPGSYEFTDFLKVGGPLQFLLAIVTTVGIWRIWGL